MPEEEWNNYILDQQINDRGIQLDLELVKKAIQCDEKVREELTSRLKELTDLDNPNSVVQMKSWLSEKGLETDSLDKASVKALLKEAPEHLSEVLELRQLLAKSSVKKYTAMENAVCTDGRARGLLQFYGANRTGRFAGTIMSYGMAWAGSAPGPVSPRDWLEGIYDYAVRVMTPEKFFLGLPAYGWNWRIHDTPENLGITYRGISNTYYAAQLWMTGGYNFTDDGPPQPMIPIIAYWDDYDKVPWALPHVYDYMEGWDAVSRTYGYLQSGCEKAIK